MVNKSSKPKSRTVYQSSTTGRYVSKQYAETHKRTTFSHVIKGTPKK